MQVSIFILKMYILSLEIYILSLKIYISKLKIEFLYRQVEFCNMRMAALQYANGIHAICELHLFLLREECFPFKKGINSSCERNSALQLIVI